MRTENKETCICPTCGKGHTISNRPIPMTRGKAMALNRIFRWCHEKGRHEFQISEIDHLLGKSSYANMSTLIHFGGLVYRPSKSVDKAYFGSGWYGLNMERCAKFFNNDYAIPKIVYRDMVTGEYMHDENDKVLFNKIPNIQKFIDKEGHFVVEYQPKVDLPGLEQSTIL